MSNFDPRAFCTGPAGLHLYALLRFFTGVGAVGSFMVCFVLAVEHVGFKVEIKEAFPYHMILSVHYAHWGGHRDSLRHRGDVAWLRGAN